MQITNWFQTLSPRQQKVAPYLALAMSVFISYASVWPNEFIFDDRTLIVGNEFLKYWSNLPELLTSLNFAGVGGTTGFYRPIPMLLHFFTYQTFGASTMAFHALNIALHAFNSCLLLYFGTRAGFGKGASFAAALLWVVHPLHTEAVAYMSATPELLWSTFCLLGLIALLPDFLPHRPVTTLNKYQAPSRQMWRAMFFFVLALGSKETAVVFPALATATLFFISEKRTRLSTYLKIGPLWLLAAGYVAIWIIFINKTGFNMDGTGNPIYVEEYTSNFINRVLTSLATLPTYARLIIWPAGLHMERLFPGFTSFWSWPVIAGAAMTTGVLLQFLWARGKRSLALCFGFLWFAAALFPATGIAFPINAMISEHWLYLPLMGLSLGTSQMLAKIFEKKKSAVRFLVFVMTLSLCTATFFQNEKWRNIETFYQNIIQNGGTTVRVRDHLGLFYMQQNEFDKAAEQFQYVIDHPLGSPAIMRAGAHLNLAKALLHAPVDENDNAVIDSRTLPFSPYIAEGIGELGKAIELNPDDPWPHQALIVVYLYQGNTAMAEFHDKKIREILQKSQAGYGH